MLEIILQATFYIIKFANITDAIFLIMPNALRCDFYWQPSQIVLAFWQMSGQLMNRMVCTIPALAVHCINMTYVHMFRVYLHACNNVVRRTVMKALSSEVLYSGNYLPYVWKCSRYQIFGNCTNNVTLANISHRCTSLVHTVFSDRHVKNNWALFQASRQ